MLKVRDLAVARGGVPIIEGLSFDVAAGQALILRGANGAGKTTLLRCLAGLAPPLKGTITAPETAYASHKDGVKAQLTVTENLAFWARIYGARMPENLMVDFDLTGLETRLAADLSAGQSRRLGLARLALTARPLLLLDEPTVSLDTASTQRFADFIQRHLAQNGCALIATHIDLGLDAPTLDLTAYRATPQTTGDKDEAFL